MSVTLPLEMTVTPWKCLHRVAGSYTLFSKMSIEAEATTVGSQLSNLDEKILRLRRYL